MKENKTIETRIFDYDDYEVVIFIKEDVKEAYLRKHGYGIMELMFGVLPTESLENFLILIKGNIDGYIEDYEEEYC